MEDININSESDDHKDIDKENNKPDENDINNINNNNKDIEEPNSNKIINKINDNELEQNIIIEKNNEEDTLNINNEINLEDQTEKSNPGQKGKTIHKSKFDKRQSSPLNLPLNLTDEENAKDDSNINNNIKKKKIQKARSFSEVITNTDAKEKGVKRNFFSELSGDPKYTKIIILKEETENELKKTVENKCSSSFIKSLVSRKKARFCYDGFDLDLTYITMKIIAMGLPSTSIESLYRNNMEDVKRFFNKRHPKHHKIYNLCEEKNYPKNTFYQQGYYPFPDHEAPQLNSLMPFCEDAKKFLDEDEKNVVAIHCKAGKGRTGTFICCLLLYLGIFDTADESMKYYGLMRVGEEKGVTIPSQKRYVNYFETIIKNKIQAPIKYKSATITDIKLYTVPHFSKFGASCTPTFIIENGKNIYKNLDYKKKATYNCSLKSIEFPLKSKGFTVNGDVLITFYHLTFFGKDKMFKFWFNSHFLPENGVLEIDKKNLDKAFKDKDNKYFSPDFKIEMKYFFP